MDWLHTLRHPFSFFYKQGGLHSLISRSLIATWPIIYYSHHILPIWGVEERKWESTCINVAFNFIPTIDIKHLSRWIQIVLFTTFLRSGMQSFELFRCLNSFNNLLLLHKFCCLLLTYPIANLNSNTDIVHFIGFDPWIGPIESAIVLVAFPTRRSPTFLYHRSEPHNIFPQWRVIMFGSTFLMIIGSTATTTNCTCWGCHWIKKMMSKCKMRMPICKISLPTSNKGWSLRKHDGHLQMKVAPKLEWLPTTSNYCRHALIVAHNF